MSDLVYVVRHGNTFDRGDVVTRVGCHTDLDLSNSGRVQARALGAHFRHHGIGFVEAVSSPLKRTRQTAEAILVAQEKPVSLQLVEFLREVDYGPDENKPEDEVVERIGADALRAWETEAVVPDGWKIDLEAIIEAWKGFFLAVSQDTARGPRLVVTSNGIARFALIAAGLKSGADDLRLKTGAYGVFEVAPDATVAMQSWNVRPA